MVIIICDSSMLILISKLEMLDLLIEAFEEILIPKAVYIESVEQGKRLKKMDAYLIEKRINEGEIIVENVKNLAEKEKFMNDFNIHEGESEALILYSEKNADLFGTDDYRTLKVCKVLKIKYFTTPSFIIRCFAMKKLSKNIVMLKFEKLEEFGWYNEENMIEFKKQINKFEG
jgi:predicted nucleic acid-binding protein